MIHAHGQLRASIAHRWRWWVPAGIAGMTVPLALSTVIWGTPQPNLRWVAATALGGALIGVLQQRILRPLGARSWWWVLANTLGWALASLVNFVLFTMVWPPWETSPAYTGLLTLVLPGATLALITGSAIAWLIRQPVQPASPRVT